MYIIRLNCTFVIFDKSSNKIMAENEKIAYNTSNPLDIRRNNSPTDLDGFGEDNYFRCIKDL